MFSDRQKIKDTGLIIAPSLEITDGMNLTGHVKVEWEDVQTGESGVCHSKSNLIVDTGKDVLVKLLKGHAATGTTYHIDAVKLGTMGHTGNDRNNPRDPVPGDSTLRDTNTANIFTKALRESDSTFAPADPALKNRIDFNIVIGTGEGNAVGQGTPARIYTEAGLFCNYTNNTADANVGNHIMFAYQTFESVVKTSLRRLNFTWSISWS